MSLLFIGRIWVLASLKAEAATDKNGRKKKAAQQWGTSLPLTGWLGVLHWTQTVAQNINIREATVWP